MATVPMGLPLSQNVIVPVRDAPVKALEAVAVKVTDWLKLDGFTDEFKPVVVATGFTVWFSVGLVLPLKPAFPL